MLAFIFIAQELPSERDSPETLRAKMGTASGGSNGMASMPLPNTANKFDEANGHESNPFGYSHKTTRITIGMLQLQTITEYSDYVPVNLFLHFLCATSLMFFLKSVHHASFQVFRILNLILKYKNCVL